MTEQNLLRVLAKHHLKITTAESCTGGLVAGVLCDISGISSYFEEGYITYSEQAKMKLLNVSAQTIQKYGVVSCETAEEMAKGAAAAANADCAVATTGVAGPTGGTEDTPVGCVCFAWVVNEKKYSERVLFEGTRIEIRMQAASYAIEMLYEYIKSNYENELD